MISFFQKNVKDNIYFWIFVVTLTLLLILLPFLAKDAGMSGDEGFQLEQAESVIDFYATWGKDTTAIAYSPQWNLPQYGQVVDNFASFAARIFNIEDVMMVRHIVNSLCGWLGILLAGLICFKITNNWRAASFGSLLLFLSPRFLGHSFNNIKDVSFAVFMLMAVFYMIVYFKSFPKVKISTVVMLALSFGLATACRIGGLLIIPYFGLFGLIFFISKYKLKGIWQSPTGKLFGKMILHGIIIAVSGYFFAVLLWPYALVSPFDHVKETFLAMSSFGTSIRQLYEGAMQWSADLPWYYIPKFILMTVPVAVIIGFLIYPFIGGCKKENCFNTFIVYFACIFPVFWIVFTNANVYGGWRHALFAYPPMVVCAGLGFNALIDYGRNKYFKIAATALPFLLLIMPLAHILKNHPYEYVYFNEFAGGVEKAYGNYELDYYYHSTREASEWIIDHAQKSGLETGDKIRIATWHTASVNYYFRKDTANFEVTFSRWYERGNNDWDYAIFVVTGIMPEQIKGNYFPPTNTIHTIEVDGKSICLILKRDNKIDYEAFVLRTKINEPDLSMEEKYNCLQTSIGKYKEALAYDPNNEVTLSSLAELYMSIGNLDSAVMYTNKLIEVCPIESYLSFASNIYMSVYERTKNQQYITMTINANERIVKNNPYSAKNQYDLAIRYASIGNVNKGKTIMDDFLKKNKANFQANYYTAIYYAQTGNGSHAIELLGKCVKKFPQHEQECRNLIRQIQGK